MDERQQPLGFFVGDDELDLHREHACQFEKSRLMQHVVSSESCHGLKRRAAPDPEPVRLLEQPFPHEVMVMAMILVHVKSQK
jgi:hypothetical protein